MDYPLQPALDWLAANEQRDIERLAELVAIESVASAPDRKDAVRDSVEWMEKELRRVLAAYQYKGEPLPAKLTLTADTPVICVRSRPARVARSETSSIRRWSLILACRLVTLSRSEKIQ